ncbi:MAG TPA: ANTAR domain-containing protein [Dermatophilaceae bacterium]|nr:ANTAR domain-containing protein [Dermatophilaceae bacterium]
MGNEQPESDFESQRRLEELTTQVAAIRAEIDALQARADGANHRAEASEARADEANHRADASEHRADDDRFRAEVREARADDDRRRIDQLEARADIDQQMIAALQADGVLSREHAAHLEEALRSSRRIGAAMGIVMANRMVSEEAAFEILRKASNDANRKVRVLADEVVHTGHVSDLPSL